MAKKRKENTELEIVNVEVANIEETKEVHEENAQDAEYTTAHMENTGESLKLTMEAEMFSGLRAAFNSTLQELLEKVMSRNIEEGEVNLKLTITLQEQNVLNNKVMIPTFKHVVTGNYKEKIEVKGGFGVPQTYLAKNKDGEYELKSLEDNLFGSETVDAEVREV